MKIQLDSGLTTVIQQVAAAPVAAFQVWIHSGSYDETDEERGLAHLHEHMLFKGTPTRGLGEIAASIEACGGQINAWTSHDQTCYHVVLPAHEWRRGLDVLADAVCHSTFDPGELTREIEVVVEEIKRAADSPGQVAYRRLFEMVFAGHPYALPVLGSEASVRSMDRDKMLAFFRKHYVAANTTVVACGDLDPAEARLAIEQAFANLPRTTAVPKPQPSGQRVTARAEVLATRFSESRVVMGWPAPPLDHPDVPALDLLAIVLGQGDSSRLVRQVQRDKMLANDIGSSTYTPLHAGLFSLTILTGADRLDAARKEALEVVQHLRVAGVEQSELEKARNNVLADATYKLETVQGLAHALGFFTASVGDPEWDRVYNGRIAGLTCADLQRVARQYLTADTLQIVQMPGTEAERPDFAGKDVTPEALLQEARGILTDPTAALAVRTPDVVDGIERIELPSGDLLLVQPDRSVPVVGLRVAALGGLREEDPESNGRSHLIAQLMTRGTSRRSGDEIAHEIETLAAGLGGFAGRNSVGVHAVALGSTRERVLELLFDCVFEAALPEGELEQERHVQLEDLRHQSDAPARQALRAMAAALYGQHPYGLDLLGTTESVKALRRGDLLDYLRRRLCPGRLVWAASGDVDPQDLAAQVVARTPQDRIPLPGIQVPEMPVIDKQIQLRMHAEKQQAHVAIGFRGTTLYRPDRYALDVLSTILSGQSGRLFMELRDKQSLAYTVSSMHTDGVDDGYFALYIGTSPDKVEQALAGLYAEMDKVLQAAVTADELDRARRYLAGAHAIGLQRRSARASTLCLNELYGLGRQAYRGQLEALLAVTADDILAAARRYLVRDKSVEVILTP